MKTPPLRAVRFSAHKTLSGAAGDSAAKVPTISAGSQHDRDRVHRL